MRTSLISCSAVGSMVLLAGLTRSYAQSYAQIAPGSALSLNGTNGYASITLSAPPFNNYTISAWVYLRSGGVFANPRVAVVSSTCGGTTEFLIRGANSPGDPQYLQLGRCFQFEGATSTLPVPLNTWAQISVSVTNNNTLGSNVVSFFINGAPAGTGYIPSTNDVSLGTDLALGYNDGSSRKFDGFLDEAQIWQGARPPVTNHVLNGAETNLLAYYRFDEGSGSTSANLALVGGNSDATLQGAAGWAVIPAPLPPPGSPVPGPDWIAQGPSPIQDIAGMGTIGGAYGILPDFPIEGSVFAAAPHPTDPDIIYAAGPNGGIWKTVNATAAVPSWIPLTDQQSSLSMGCLDFDPLDGSHQTLVAGFGNYSSSVQGAALLGLLRTTDGGNSWQRLSPSNLVGASLNSLAARANVLLAASSSQTALYRSADGGMSFTNLAGSSGLPVGYVDAIAGVPMNTSRFYAASRNKGIYRSEDTGATWINVSSGITNPATGCGPNTSRVALAVHHHGGAEVVYASVYNYDSVHSNYSTFIYSSTNSGTNWTSIGQAFNYYGSLRADPTNAFLAYIGGNGIDIQRIDRSQASFTSLVDSVFLPGGKSVHADSHSIRFDASGNLIETDDGGIYLLPRDAATSGTNGVSLGGSGGWRSLLGNLQTGEFWGIAYDPHGKVLIGALQDNGIIEQPSSGSPVWDIKYGGDGFKVAVDARSTPGQSFRYENVSYITPLNYYSNGTIYFHKRVFDSTGQLVATVSPSLSVLAGLPFIPGSFALELNAVDPRRMVVGSANALYESTDQGETLRQIAALSMPVYAQPRIVYGGMLNGIPNPDLVWVCGANGNLYLRTNAAGNLQAAAFTNGAPGGIVVNPTNWHLAYVISSTGVFTSSNAGVTWQNITANLSGGFVPRSIEFLPLPSGDALAVGTDDGVYVLRLGQGMLWWTRLGSSLPRAIAFNIRYDASDQVFALGTIGRGAWTYSLAGWPQAGGPGTALNLGGAATNFVAASFLPALSKDYTISAWINLRTGGKTLNPRVAIFSSTNCGGNAEFLVRSATTNLTDPQYLELARCGSIGGFDGTLSTVPVPLNQWVHVAVTVGPNLGSGGGVSNLVSYYVNGNPAGSSYYLNRNLSIGTNAALGLNYESLGRKFDGLLDQVAVWGTAIAPSIIPLTMAKQPTGNVIDGALVMSFNFDEGTGTNVQGLTAGSLVGGANWVPSGAVFQSVATATTRPAQNITASSTTLTASFTPQMVPLYSEFYFEYGLTTNYGNSIPQSVTPRETATLNGVNDFIATSQLVTNPQTFSLSLWFKTTSKLGGRMIGFGNSQTNVSAVLDRHLFLGTDGLVRFGVYGDTFYVIPGATVCNDGRWHHATGTFSPGDGMRLYVDGVQVATNGIINAGGGNAAFNTNGYWRIGWDEMSNWPAASANSHFAGALAEVQIWNTVLSPEFIAANYDCPLTGLEPGLVNYYRLDEGGGPIMADSAPASGPALGFVYGDPVWTTSQDFPLCFSQALNALEPAATYHFRASGTNTVGVSHSVDRSFTTLSPTLLGKLNGGTILLSWQNPATGFLLEESPALTPPLWSVVPPPYFTNGTTMQTNLPLNGQTMFFRLSRP